MARSALTMDRVGDYKDKSSSQLTEKIKLIND